MLLLLAPRWFGGCAETKKQNTAKAFKTAIRDFRRAERRERIFTKKVTRIKEITVVDTAPVLERNNAKPATGIGKADDWQRRPQAGIKSSFAS